MGKSQDACVWSCECVRDPHLWTFTRPDCVEPRYAAASWQLLLHDLVLYLEFRGVRVFELHPSGHGLHVHVVAEGYYRIQDVEAYCIRHGWGRRGAGLDVVRIDAGAVAYVAKYIRPSRVQAKGLKMPRGVRLWAAFNMGGNHVRVKDVEYDTPRSRAYRAVARVWSMTANMTDRERRVMQLRLMRFAKMVHDLGQIEWLQGGCVPDALDTYFKDILTARRSTEEVEREAIQWEGDGDDAPLSFLHNAFGAASVFVTVRRTLRKLIAGWSPQEALLPGVA